jgi:putative Mg2+ transporter-C (MgtC) family protein
MFDILSEEFADPFSSIELTVVLTRLLAAMFLGGLIGWERHLHNKPAGMRTHMMIALAACVFTLASLGMIASDWGPQTSAVKFDPLRLIAAITSGVAFLAAGTIINARGHIHGLTTGAGMWLAGALGLACGAGQIPLAALATGLALIVLWVLRRFEVQIPDPPDSDPG